PLHVRHDVRRIRQEKKPPDGERDQGAPRRTAPRPVVERERKQEGHPGEEQVPDEVGRLEVAHDKDARRDPDRQERRRAKEYLDEHDASPTRRTPSPERIHHDLRVAAAAGCAPAAGRSGAGSTRPQASSSAVTAPPSIRPRGVRRTPSPTRSTSPARVSRSSASASTTSSTPAAPTVKGSSS